MFEVKKVTDFNGVLNFMNDKKPFMHLKEANGKFELSGLVKIPQGFSHSVRPVIETNICNMEKYVVVNLEVDNSVTEPYILSLKVDFGQRLAAKIPIAGIKVFGPGTPEEGKVMVGEDDADDRP